MNYFQRIKKDPNKEYDNAKRNTVWTQTCIYFLVAGYVLYLLYGLLVDFINGSSTLSLAKMVIFGSLMATGSIFLIVFALVLLPSSLSKSEIIPEEPDDSVVTDTEESSDKEISND